MPEGQHFQHEYGYQSARFFQLEAIHDTLYTVATLLCKLAQQQNISNRQRNTLLPVAGISQFRKNELFFFFLCVFLLPPHFTKIFLYAYSSALSCLACTKQSRYVFQAFLCIDFKAENLLAVAIIRL